MKKFLLKNDLLSFFPQSNCNPTISTVCPAQARQFSEPCSFTHARCNVLKRCCSYAAMQIRSSQIHNTLNMLVQKVFNHSFVLALSASPLPEQVHYWPIASS